MAVTSAPQSAVAPAWGVFFVVLGLTSPISSARDPCAARYPSKRALDRARDVHSTTVVLTLPTQEADGAGAGRAGKHVLDVFEDACRAFEGEPLVAFAILHHPAGNGSITAFIRKERDYSCLLPAPLLEIPRIEALEGSTDVGGLVASVNRLAGTHRLPSGGKSVKGTILDSIVESLYVPEGEGSCEEVEFAALNSSAFLRDYVLRNRPVLLKGAAKSWPAMEKWSAEYLASASGDMEVRVACRTRHRRPCRKIAPHPCSPVFRCTLK